MIDQAENTYEARPVVFVDDEGIEIPSWRVPLDRYIAEHESYARAHEGYRNDWVLAHRIVVARAIVQGCSVPEEVLAQESIAELSVVVERERRINASGHVWPGWAELLRKQAIEAIRNGKTSKKALR